MRAYDQKIAWTICVLLLQLSAYSAWEDEAKAEVLTDHLAAPSTKLAQELGIIPAPKEIHLTNKRFALPRFSPQGQPPAAVIVLAGKPSRQAKIGAQEINNAIKTATGYEIPVRTAESLSVRERDSASLILIGQPAENAMLEQECAKRRIKLSADDPGPQGYQIVFAEDGKRQLAILAGCDSLGMLYACVTFCQLVRVERSNAYAVEAHIRDWPDARWRFTWTMFLQALQVAKRPNGQEEALRMAKAQVDWLLRHKINVCLSYHAGKALHAMGDERLQPWYREVFEYAFDRGLWGYTFPAHDALGWAPKEQPRPDLDLCFSYGNPVRYWCWSRDEMMDRRYDEAAREIAANMPPSPGIGGMFLCLHMPDTANMGWHKRCEQCRKQYGNDQGAAQSHVFNRFYEAMRRHVPSSKIILVPRPYAAWDLDAPKNQVYRERVEKIAKSIPQDAFIVHVHGPREAIQSWKRAVGDRHLMHWNVGTWDSRSYYFGGDDLFAFTDGWRFGADALKILGAVEYMWNVNAPGSIELHSDPRQPYFDDLAIDEADTIAEFGRSRAQYSSCTVDGLSVWHRSLLPFERRLPPEVLRHEEFAARHLYGEEAAPHMLRVLACELGQYVGLSYWWDLSFTPQSFGIAGGPKHSVSSAQWRAILGDLEAAASALETLVLGKIRLKTDPQIPMNLPAVLASYRTVSKAKVWVALVEAHEAASAFRQAEAAEALSRAEKILAAEKESLRKTYERFLRSRPGELTQAELERAISSLETEVQPYRDALKTKLPSR